MLLKMFNLFIKLLGNITIQANPTAACVPIFCVHHVWSECVFLAGLPHLFDIKEQHHVG